MTVKFRSGDSYQDPKPGYTYISPSLKSFAAPDRNIRIARGCPS